MKPGVLTVLLMIAASIACGGDSPTSPSVSPLRGIVTDPTGDPRPAFPSFIVAPDAVVPDLVGASIEVSSGILTVVVSFSPGTLVPGDFSCAVYLDTDENPATGERARIGADYNVFFTAATVVARVNRWEQTSYVSSGTADLTFPSATQARVSFPLSLLDNDDGRLMFMVQANARLTGGTSGTFDTMPDFGVAAGVTR